MTIHALRDERGMTLIELILALLVFSAVIAGALGFLRTQSRSFALGNERLGMLQNARFAITSMEKDLRTAGAANPDEQPAIVYAGNSVVAFNGNYITNVGDDIFGVYYNPDAPSGTVAALTASDRITIPGTSFSYPDTTYFTDPARTLNSPSETIVFFFALDSSTVRPDDYILYRQVNAEAPELLAQNLLAVSATPLLRYYRHQTVAGVVSLAQIPSASMPMAHSVPVHLSLGDTGVAARVDSVKAVQVTFTASNGMAGTAERQRTISRLIRLPNAGLRMKKTCGDEPQLGSVLGAQWDDVLMGVRLNWAAAIDETMGEKDVVRYVIYRKLASDPPGWNDVEPFLSIPAGSAPYQYVDGEVTPGATYLYALAAQDCTPQTSGVAQSPPASVPNP
jgi:prepilin-type N-terminal cleavage/methylation domain-containing protein